MQVILLASGTAHARLWNAASSAHDCRQPVLTYSPCRYVLAYIETSRGVRKGDKVWQLAFGSGMPVAH